MGEVKMAAWPGGKPALDVGVLVGAVVVDDEVQGQVGIDVSEEAQELLEAMARLVLGKDPAGDDIQGGEECGGAVADVAVRHAFDVVEPEGPKRLGALQGLGLALLVDAQNHGMVGRMEMEADNVADLLNEERVGGELEVLLLVGLKVERGPEALDRGLGHLGGSDHGTAGPVRVASVGCSRASSAAASRGYRPGWCAAFPTGVRRAGP